MSARVLLIDRIEVTGRGRSARSRRRGRGRGRSVLLPAGFALVAILAAAVLAFGTRASLAQYSCGIDTIVQVRRMQWLLVGVSLIGCTALLTMVIANRRPVGWLVVLAPVLALFTVRFGPSPKHFVVELDATQFVDPHGAAAADEPVVGVVFEGRPYAFPCRALSATPVVAVTDYNKRMILIWSPRASRAVARHVTRDLRPRALEVVASPAGGMLLLDRRYGQFISSITGRLTSGGEAIGFAGPVDVTKTTFAAWQVRHPQTRVMPAFDVERETETDTPVELPTVTSPEAPAELRVAMIEIDPPIALPSDVQLNGPINLLAGEQRLMVVRDPRTGALRAFDRRVSDDLFPTFAPHGPGMADSDTKSTWSFDGRATAGPLEGERLREIPVEDGLYWGVMKFWYPRLTLLRLDAQ